MPRRFLWLISLLLIVAVPPARAQERRKADTDPAEWVPADALVYVGVTDTERFWSDFTKTTTYRAMTDKELAKSDRGPDVIARAVEKFKAHLAKALEVEADALKSPFSGPLALYLTAPRGGGPKEIEPGLVAGVGDSELMQKYFDNALRHLKDAAHLYEPVSAGDATIHVFTSRGADQAKKEEKTAEEPDFSEKQGLEAFLDKFVGELFTPESMPDHLAACLTKERLILAGSAGQVRRVLAREKAGQTLAGTDDYKALLQHLKPLGELRLLVNLPRVFEIARADWDGGEEDYRRTMSILGTSSLRSVVGHLRVGAKSYDGKFELLFLMSGERTGLAKVLSMDNQPVAPASVVPAAAGLYASVNVAPARLLDEITRMIRQGSPDAADAFQRSLEQVPLSPGAEPINLRKDVLDHLGGPLTAYAGFTRPFGAGSLRLLVSLGHRNRDALGRFASLLPGATPRDVRGTPVYSSPMFGPLTLAVTSDQILAGNLAALEATLAGDTSDSLAEEVTFRRAARLVPKEAWLVLFVDQRKLTEALLELAKKKEDVLSDPSLAAILMFMQRTGSDFSDTATTRRMLDYAQATIMTVASTTEGVQITAVELKPKED